jgi:Spy/CpxP family protein refolding chaperone
MFPFAGRFGKHFGIPPFGFGHHGGRGGCGGFGHEGMLQDLDLTDDQVERIAELKAEGMGEGMQLMAQGSQFFKQLMHELANENIDRDKVKEAHKKLQEHKTKMGDAMLERALTFAEMLTAEQRKKLKRSAMRRFLGLDGDQGRHEPGGPGFGFGPGGPGPGGPGGPGGGPGRGPR